MKTPQTVVMIYGNAALFYYAKETFKDKHVRLLPPSK